MKDFGEPPEYVVYMLRCSDGTFYTGITNDLARRLREHNTSKRGAKYTRARRPVKLMGYAPGFYKPEALRFERELKKQPKKLKSGYLLALSRRPF